MGHFMDGREFPKYLKWRKRDFFQNIGSREIYFKMIKTYGKPVGNFHGWPGISEISEMETERFFQTYRFSRNIFQNDQNIRKNLWEISWMVVNFRNI